MTTNPTPPASPTSARNVPTNLDVLGARLQVIRDTDPPMSIIALNQLIDEIDHASKTYRPPSPPAVVGKPTKAKLECLLEWLAPEDREEAVSVLLAAPIWPTSEPPKADEPYKLTIEELHEMDKYQLDEPKQAAEPPATVDDEVAKIDVEAVGRKIFSSPYYKGSVENARRDAHEVMLLITGKKG